MPGWMSTVLVLLVIFVVIPIVWTWLQERGGKIGKAADAAEAATDFIGAAVVKLVGAGALLVGVTALVMLFVGDFSWLFLLGGPLLIAYGIYLVTPGERSLFIIF